MQTKQNKNTGKQDVGGEREGEKGDRGKGKGEACCS